MAGYEKQYGWHPAVLEALVNSPGNVLVGLYLLRHQHEETGRKFLRLARETGEPRSHVQALIKGMIRQQVPSDDRQ